ncbi:MAG: glycosyltransferase family 2 protein, partial [Acidobacteriota bacterium]
MHLSSVTNLTESTPDSARPATLRAGVGISVVLPVRNEQQNLEELDRELRETLTALGRKSEIIYADDHSTDNSPQILQRLLAAPQGQSIRTRVVTLRRNYGQTAALAAGIDLAEGEIIILLDADGQNDPADIPHLVEKLEQGFDVVSGWRR